MDKIKILIVEDSVTQAMQLQNVLDEHGYDTAIAANGREALQSIEAFKPEIVLSDIMMPEMDGYELCRQIKSNETTRDISVLLLTFLSQPQAVIWALQCGADKFITKPYDEKGLLSTIEHLRLNRNLHNEEDVREGIQITYRGENYLIASSRHQILNLLLSTYETALAKNMELMAVEDELRQLNRELENRVEKRTESLRVEVAERKAAQAELMKKNEELNAVTQQLWQTAKLATMGELASSVAHELNNPLATVSLRIESLTARMSADDPRLREFDIIGQEVERMGNLVTNLLQFSRRSQQQISTVDIGEEIEKTIELIRYHLHKNNIEIVTEIDSKGVGIHADRQQLRQLFLNLFTNACDAMPEGGTLTVSVSVKPGDKRFYIEVADTGTGIPPDILPKIMEPFYTTKPEGKGTGLGLAICRRIVQEHSGTIDIISSGEAGKGTVIRVTLLSAGNGNSVCLEEP